VEKVSLPVRFKEEFKLEKTHLLAQVVENGTCSGGFLQHLDLHKPSTLYRAGGLHALPLIVPVRLYRLTQAKGSQHGEVEDGIRPPRVPSWSSETGMLQLVPGGPRTADDNSPSSSHQDCAEV